ncbi:MAG: hypothetical protein ACYS1A_17350 [Planctomycetota bacterium]
MPNTKEKTWVVLVELLLFVILAEAARSVVEQMITFLAQELESRILCVLYHMMLLVILVTVHDKEVLDEVERLSVTLDFIFESIMLFL